MEARTFPFSRTMSCPATRALPEVGRSRVVSIRTSVVFPAPFGPRRPYVSPGRTSNVTASSAIVSPNFRVSFSAWIGLTVMRTKVPAPGARRKGGSPRSMRARLDHAGRVSHESAFLFEVLHFSEARLERILLGADLTLFRFARADGGGGPVAAMLHALQVRGRSDSLAHQPRHSFFLARDLRE